MTETALIDVDGMIYAAGAIAETVYYTLDGMRFDYKSQANKYAEDSGLNKADIEKEVDAQPASHALNALKMTVEAAVKASGAVDSEAYLSPQDRSNFRFEIDPEYKANRKDAHKPTHFAALRKYAVNTLGAVIVEGMEADDMLAIRAFELGMDNVVIISVDKDMRQLPCYHYDWRKKTPVWKVGQGEAWLNFYTQLLVGDAVDNIKGCPGIGPAKARKALKECKTDEEMMTVCAGKYLEAFDGDEEEALRMMKQQAQLLHLLEVRP